LIVSTGDHAEVKKLEEERQYQVIPAGYPVEEAVVAAHRRRKKQKLSRQKLVIEEGKKVTTAQPRF